MNTDDFNLEDEYGGLLDFLESYIPEAGDESVEHYGVKGMHWGVRKEQSSKAREPLKSLGPDSVSRKTASGETVTLQKIKPNKLSSFLGKVSKKYREGYSKQAALNILDSSGKKIGDAHVQKKNDEELYLNWLGINKSARGKGYATAVMKAGRDFGKQEGFKKMTLEVPGNSPDARHIYEKLGFKVTGQDNSYGTEMWGGLTNMEYNFDEVQHFVDDLVHYGVKGMHWGVRKAERNAPNSNYTSRERVRDKRIHGKRGVERINRRLNKGYSLRESRRKEVRRNFAQLASSPVVAYGALVAAYTVKEFAHLSVQNISVKAETNRGRAFMADTMGLPGKPTDGPTYAKKSRGGAHKITSL